MNSIVQSLVWLKAEVGVVEDVELQLVARHESNLRFIRCFFVDSAMFFGEELSYASLELNHCLYQERVVVDHILGLRVQVGFLQVLAGVYQLASVDVGAGELELLGDIIHSIQV